MAWLDAMREWLRALFLKAQEERELDEELRFHLERAEAEKVRRGMSRSEAARAARLEIGGVESVKERVRGERGTRWLEDLGKDLVFGLRTLRRSPAFAAAAILTLALGIGGNIAMFSIFDGVLLRPLPYPGADRLVLIWTTIADRGMDRSLSSPHDVDDWRAGNRTFDEITAFSTRSAKLSGGEQPEMIRLAQVVPGFFRTMGVPPVLGRGFLDAERDGDAGRVAVIGHALWQSRFGGAEDVLGRTLQLDDERVEIVGVAAPSFDFPGADVALWTPLPRPLAGISRSSYWTVPIGRLEPGASAEQAAADLGLIMRRLAADHPENRGLGVRLERLHEVAVGDARPTLRLLWITVAFVLLLACANVAHLLLARANGRQKEMVIRTSLGASRSRVLRQLLAESLALALLGGVLGVGLAAVAIELLPSLAADTLPRVGEVVIDGRALTFALAASLLTGLLFGALPAFRVTRASGPAVLKQGGQRSVADRSSRWQSLIVVGETAAALVLLVGAVLLLRSLGALLDVDPGFRPERLLSVRLSPVKKVQFSGDEEAYRAAYGPERERIRAFYRDLSERIGGLAGVSGVALVNQRPLAGSAWGVRVVVEGSEDLEPTELPTAASRVVEPGYFRTLGIPLEKGRTFTASDQAGDGGVAVISRATAEMLWPGEDAVGRTMSFRDGQWVRVVGVVGDVRDQSLESPAKATIYSPFAGATHGFHSNWTMDVLVRTEGDPMGSAEAIRALVAQADAELPIVEEATMSEEIHHSTARRRFTTGLLGAFGVVALALAIIGLYGVIAYSVARRVHELGIRLAVGASRQDIFALVIRRGLALVAAGLIGGLAAAWMLSRLIGSFLYRLQPTDPLSYASAAMLLGVVASLACIVPAHKATRLDPLRALRHE